MKTYHKIQTVFLRDPEDNYKTLLEGQYAKPEFEYLRNCLWTIDEKLDGTNIRILWDGKKSEIRGKTDNAQLHVDLITNIQNLVNDDKLREIFGSAEDDSFDVNAAKNIEVCLYGEGVGPGIQKGGGGYGPEKTFILFDVLVGSFWLQRKDVEDIANVLGMQIAPVIATGTLDDVVEMTRAGFKSQYGDFIAEGVIARPVVPLTNRFGERVITKLKHSDFSV